MMKIVLATAVLLCASQLGEVSAFEMGDFLQDFNPTSTMCKTGTGYPTCSGAFADLLNGKMTLLEPGITQSPEIKPYSAGGGGSSFYGTWLAGFTVTPNTARSFTTVCIIFKKNYVQQNPDGKWALDFPSPNSNTFWQWTNTGCFGVDITRLPPAAKAYIIFRPFLYPGSIAEQDSL